MVEKKYWKKPIEEFLRLVESETEKKTVSILGITFHVIPGVFSPLYSSDTEWFAKRIVPLTKGKKFLEIGSGSGIIACLAALNNAEVTATDISPKAIENININANLHCLNLQIKQGSVYEPLEKDEKFDIIFWNHPFYFSNEKVKNALEYSVFDESYSALKMFFKDGKKHLQSGGQLILGTSNVARINLIKKIAREECYHISLMEKIIVPVYRGKKIKMDLRIYSFSD